MNGDKAMKVIELRTAAGLLLAVIQIKEIWHLQEKRHRRKSRKRRN